MGHDAISPELFAELHGLTAASLLGQVTSEQAVRLQALLADSTAQQLYLELIFETNTLLTWADFPRSQADGGVVTSKPTSAPSPLMGEGRSEGPPVKSPVLGFLGGLVDYVSNSRSLLFWLMFAGLGLYFAVQLGSVIVGRFWAQNAAQLAEDQGAASDRRGQVVEQPDATAGGARIVARLTNAIDCQWRIAQRPSPRPSPIRGEGAVALDVGAEIHAGQKLNLAAGLAELTFDSGAKMILTAPARFNVADALGGELQVGKLTAKVPHEAAGFTVVTPGGKVVDLGTEFGVKVRDDGVMNVIVYVGEVKVESGGGGSSSGGANQAIEVRVKAGQAVTVLADRTVKPIPIEDERFIRDLTALGDRVKAEAAYVEFMKSLKPVVWFRMEGKSDERLLHDAVSGRDAQLNWDGPGNPFVKGRLGKSLWLRGEKLKDCAEFPKYPQAAHDKLSIVAWAFADSLPVIGTIASDWTATTGQFHFGLSPYADRVLMVHLTGRDNQLVRLGEGAGHTFPLYEWQHVAFTTDGATARLYRQGREVASLKHAGLLYPAPNKTLGIGAKSPDAPNDHCFWDGKLDEIAIFHATLTAEEIRKLAAAPPR